MSRLIDGIKANNFVIVGRAGIDFFTDAGVSVEDAERMSVDLGGSAANIGAGICKLGGAAALVTRVSDDSVGSYCTRRLQHYGVDTAHVKTVGGEFRNSLAVYESVLETHRNVIYRNGAADFQMDMDDVEAVDFSRFSAFVTAGTVFAAEPSRAASFRAIERAKAANLPIIFDVDYRPYSWPSPQVASEVLSRAAEASDMIVGNDDEFGFMAGSYDQGPAKAKHLAETTASVVIFKKGPDGALTYADGTEIVTGIFPVDALKPVGAGDSFMAGLLTAIAAGYELKEAILRGSACASITVSRPGCAPALPNRQELNDFLAAHPGPTIG